MTHEELRIELRQKQHHVGLLLGELRRISHEQSPWTEEKQRSINLTIAALIGKVQAQVELLSALVGGDS
jgi:hypothetical protein